VVASSEAEHGHRNAALAHFLASYGNLEDPVGRVLDHYFRHCAVAMSCAELALAGSFLARHGVRRDGSRLVSRSDAKRINAVMLTCGTYDAAGEFAYRVGVPYLAVQARIELARCHLALGDVTAARMLLREVDQILTRRPGLGVVVQQADDMRAELSAARDTSAPRASALTVAELRLLPMLSTHLSFPEIAREVFLSCNTIKSQAYSIYRKLGASSRSQAVTRSRELGLLEG
jgi:DNA-binding NarL/FixJ family response regulator